MQAGGVFVFIIQRKELLTMPIIDVKATGNNIKNIIKSKGFKISDVQARCGFNTPQAIQSELFL